MMRLESRRWARRGRGGVGCGRGDDDARGASCRCAGGVAGGDGGQVVNDTHAYIMYVATCV